MARRMGHGSWTDCDVRASNVMGVLTVGSPVVGERMVNATGLAHAGSGNLHVNRAIPGWTVG